ncbi:MAG: hypothetical protein IJ604_09410 [Prevotella sp.]|nr:hypothetical protein [Prevotella sp.]
MSRIIDIELALMYAAALAAVATVAWSAVKELRMRRGNSSNDNLIPARRITGATLLLLLISLLATFLCGSGAPIRINGTEYAHRFWLKASDMLINTSLILLVAAAIGIAFSISGYCRRNPKSFFSRRN